MRIHSCSHEQNAKRSRPHVRKCTADRNQSCPGDDEINLGGTLCGLLPTESRGSSNAIKYAEAHLLVDLLAPLLTPFSTSAMGIRGDSRSLPGFIPKSSSFSYFFNFLNETARHRCASSSFPSDSLRPFRFDPLESLFIEQLIVRTVVLLNLFPFFICIGVIRIDVIIAFLSSERRSAKQRHAKNAARQRRSASLNVREAIVAVERSDAARAIVRKGNLVLPEVVRVGARRAFHVRGIMRAVQHGRTRVKRFERVLRRVDVDSHFVGDERFQA